MSHKGDGFSLPLEYTEAHGGADVSTDRTRRKSSTQALIPPTRWSFSHLACKLHEGFGNQGVMGKAVGLIGRKSIAEAML